MASQDFKSIEDKVKASLLTLTRSVGQLANEDLSFQRSANTDVADQLDDANDRLLNLASGLLKSATKNTKISAPELEDADDIDLRWRGIVDVVDSLLEKADTSLDEYTGLVRRQESQAVDTTPRPNHTSGKRSGILSASLRNANIPKPQLLFEQKPDNFKAPWKPILTSKPHAKVPLEDSLKLFVHEGKTTATRYAHKHPSRTPNQKISTPAASGSRGRNRPLRKYETHTARYRNPYEAEIQQVKLPDFAYQQKDPTPYLPTETTAATWVDTFDGVLEMLSELKTAKEIAIDLEHHDYRTYIGLTSLMQISTRKQDWIVDTLQPWRHRLEVLNEVFADPNILKVFHGSFMDMIWLQRDFGLYVVGLFDTGCACEALSYPGRSLAYLLKRFVDFDADKKYQLADWRIRPLPEEMLYYARSDTHYLLYIYDQLRNSLLEASDPNKPDQNRMEWTVQKSKEQALQLYEGLAYGEDGKGPMGWRKPLYRVNPPSKYTDAQFAVYRAVHKWRDDLARSEDENPGYIMPQHAIYEMSRHIPTDLRAVISCLGHNSPGARFRLEDLLGVIKQASSDPNPVSYKNTFYAEINGIAVQPTPIPPQATKEDTAVGVITRSTRSQMFGDLPVSSIWDDKSGQASNAMQDAKIEVPWAKYVQAAMIEETLDSKLEDTVAESIPIPPAERQVENDDQFTLKTGRKRKSQSLNNSQVESSEEDTSSSDPDSNSSLDGESVVGEEGQNQDVEMDDAPVEECPQQPEPEGEQANKSKKSKNKKRAGFKKGKKETTDHEPVPIRGGKGKRKNNRASKAAKAKAKSEEAKEKKGATDYETFDYSKAKSVMKASGSGKDKKTRKIYNKNLEGDIKGARRTNYEKPGRSQTFKN